MRIPISEIKINPGRREVDPEDVKELADSIRDLGLLHPIIVDKNYTLIAGLHRLEAVKLLEWTEIECTVSSLEGLKAELAEIDENVIRSDLTALEFGELLLKRKDIYETLHPEVKATYNGGGFKGNQHKNSKRSVVTEDSSVTTKSFVQDTAEKLGVTPRTVEKQIQTAKNLTPETKTIIRETDTKIGKERLTLAQATNALAESGTDEDIRTVKSLIEANGFIWALSRRSGAANEIGSIRALMKSWRALGDAEFSRMLMLLRCTWGGHPGSLTSFVLSGMTLFLKTYGTEMDDRLFIRQLSKVDPNEIIKRGKVDFSTSGNALRFARIILEKYNNQRKNTKKLPYRFDS